jgi:hypothetical protein
MNFEQEIRKLQHDTAVVMTEIQRLQAEWQKHHAEHVEHMQEGMRIHELCMAHVDTRLASITCKLGLMGGFRGPQ